MAIYTLNTCDLIDLGYHSNKFTWANNQADNHHIKERLYKFCATSNAHANKFYILELLSVREW